MTTFPVAYAFPPRAEYLFPTERWLAGIADAGYTHLCLQNDPFVHEEADLEVSAERDYRLLNLFDLTTGPRHGAYLQWLGALGERADGHGLRLAIQLWEPRLTHHAGRVLPDDWQGPPLHGGMANPLCVSNPSARSWLIDSFATVVEASSSLDTIILGINDNLAELCDNRCPRCAEEPVQSRLGALYADIERRCRRASPGLQIVVYDWFWDLPNIAGQRGELGEAILTAMPPGTPILTRMEHGATHIPDPDQPQWSGPIFDMAVGSDALGPEFELASELAERFDGSLLVMPTLSGMYEAFQLPYVPAVGQMAAKFQRMRDHGVQGWVDYDCGGIHLGLMLDLVKAVQRNPDGSAERWQQILADDRYGPAAASIAHEIWAGFDEAVRRLPLHLRSDSVPMASGRIGISIALLPMHPFLPDRARRARDAYWEHHIFDPHNIVVPELLPGLRRGMRRALDAVATVRSAYEQLVSAADADRPPAARHDADLAELVLLSWQSAAHFFEWAAAVQGDASVPLDEVLNAEADVTERYRRLARRPELEVGNMTWPPEVTVGVSCAGLGSDLYQTKLEGLAAQRAELRS